MVSDSKPPSTIEFSIGNQSIAIKVFDAAEPAQNLDGQAVNIIASGPSIAQLSFAKLLDTPTIFVNGSISLTGQHDFTDVVGYIISDARFIRHHPRILQEYYKGQPLYATFAVFEALATTFPDLISAYHQAMRVISPVDRPWQAQLNKSLLSKLVLRKNRKKPLSYFSDNPNFVINDSHKPAPIGVALDITHGFVEAGTVAYVAAQLAFSKGAGAIHLYGIDLLNTSQPRFYENQDNSAPSKLDKAVSDRIVPSFNLLSKVYKKHGVPVFNHSPVSKDLFDRD